MKAVSRLGAVLLLAARAAASDNGSAPLNFNELAYDANVKVVGDVNAVDFTSMEIPPVTSPPATAAPTMANAFASAADYTAAHVDADPIDATLASSSSAPTATTASAVNVTFAPTVAVTTATASMAFTALPSTVNVDLQGFIFADRTNDDDSAVPSAEANATVTPDVDALWQARVCSSSPDTCAVVTFGSDGHDRRLAASTPSPTPVGDLSKVEEALSIAAGFKTASALATLGIAFASGPFAVVLGSFAFVLTLLFSASAGSAYVELLKAVNKQYKDLNDAVEETGVRFSAAAEIRSMRRFVREAYAYDLDLRTLASSTSATDAGALAIKIRGYCAKKNLYTTFYDGLMDTTRFKTAIASYYITRSRGYVGECAFYLQGLYAAYLSYIKCELVSNPDMASIKTADQKLRDLLATTAKEMATTALKMRSDMVEKIKEEIKSAVNEGDAAADVRALTDKYDWLEFKAYRSDTTRCESADSNVVDSRCGLVTVSKSTCHFVAWRTKYAENKDDKVLGEIKASRNLYDTYVNKISDSEKCGFGAEGELTELPTRRPMARELQHDDRRLVGRQIAGMNVYVKSTRASATSVTVPTAPDAEVDKSVLSGANDPLQEKLNNAKSEKERMKILSESYTNTSTMSQSIKSRDMAVWFALETNLKEVNDMYDERDTMVDGISTTVKDVHSVEMGRIKGIHDDLVFTGAQEVQSLVNLEVQTTGQHNEELAEMDVIDGQLTTLSNTLDTGFSGTASDIDSVERDTTSALNQLAGTVQETGAKTRTEVKRVIAQATQQTLEHLDGLDMLIQAKAGEKIAAVRGLQSLVENAGNKIRAGVASEFNARAQQLQERVAGLTYHISSTASLTTNALVSESDAMRTELGRRLAFMTNQLEIIDGRINATGALLDKINTQVDDILGLVGTINAKLSGIFRTLRDLPNRLRQVVMVKTVEDKFRDAERLSFAYANYIKHNMNQLQAFEFVQQCDAAAEALLFDNLLDRLKRGEAVLQKELASFNNSRVEYEQFGTRIVAAAYHLRFMLVPCANMRTLKATGHAEFSESTSRAQADKLNTAVWTFQLSMEETVPQLFLKKIYTAPFLVTLLGDVRRNVGAAESGYALTAIEPLRYQLQQHLGSFASVSVIHPDQKSRLVVWSKATKVSLGASRFGALRLSAMSGASPSMVDDLLVLWSNTKLRIPTALQPQFRIPLTKADLASDATVAAALKNTAYEPFWTAGFVQSIVFVERVNKTVCPWAIATAAYPNCWETGTYDDGGCVCVQLEGLAPSIKAAGDDGPTPWALQTVVLGTTPRSNFVVTAVNKASTVALNSSTMIGEPANRKAFAVCMSSPLPPRECLAGKWCHQPPPSVTRCLANPAETYNIVYPTAPSSTSAQGFIQSGLSVTADMFRLLELGAGIPDITFFDGQSGLGSYIVCTECTMTVLKSVYMFRVMSFKIGRPPLEKTSVCRQHPRYENVEFCTRGPNLVDLWTPQTLLQGELIQTIQQFGLSLPANISDPQELATLVNARVQTLLSTQVSYFKVYIATTGSFNATTNGGAYWTSLPTQEAGDERGWTSVPTLYSTIVNNKALVFDALVMWSTLPVQERNFAKLVLQKKPAGQSLKAYLQSAFGAYDREKILRGYFSEPFDGLDCPVAGDTDHFAYCTPTPVDKMCSCVQLEDLPEEYTELYDGSAPHGKVVSFQVDASSYVVGRTKGPFTLGASTASATWDGFPMRNVSDRSVCVADVNHPELGKTCVLNEETSSLPLQKIAVSVGVGVPSVTIATPTWTAQCVGCSDAFVSQVAAFSGAVMATLVTGGTIAGGACRSSPAEGGGVIEVCLNQNA